MTVHAESLIELLYLESKLNKQFHNGDKDENERE